MSVLSDSFFLIISLLGEILSGKSGQMLARWRTFSPTNVFARWIFLPKENYQIIEISGVIYGVIFNVIRGKFWQNIFWNFLYIPSHSADSKSQENMCFVMLRQATIIILKI